MLASSSDPKREFGELRSRASMRLHLAVSSTAVAINNECFVMVLIDETSCEMVLTETLHEKRSVLDVCGRIPGSKLDLVERISFMTLNHISVATSPMTASTL